LRNIILLHFTCPILPIFITAKDRARFGNQIYMSRE